MGNHEKGQSTFKGSEANNNKDYTNIALNEKGDVLLETDKEKRERRISLWIIYISVFVQSMGASIVITGVWPYLQSLDSDTSKEWLGGIVAANPFGQLIFSPLIGWWCNRVNSVRIPSIFCLVVFTLSNFWYALLPLHTANVKYYMFLARFLVGVSSGSISACRTHVTQGTLLKERTAAISMLSLCQSLGFILGPVIQYGLTQMDENGIPITGNLVLTMYTAAGWIAAIVGAINLILLLPMFFQESNISEREALANFEMKNRQVPANEKKEPVNWSKIPPDYIGLAPLIYGFFVVFFCFSLLETLGTPATIDQFGWSYTQAIRNVGIATAISSILALLCFLTIPALCKRFDERIILIGLGMVPMVVGRFFFFPFGGSVAPKRIEGCVDLSGGFKNFTSKSSCDLIEDAHWTVVQHGCPEEQDWCFQISALSKVGLAVGYGICTIGYPYSVVLLVTIYSKMLGPRPQGIWMGALTAISSLARVVGPVFVTYIYTEYGTIVTSATATGLMFSAFISLVIVYRRLVPARIPNSFGL